MKEIHKKLINKELSEASEYCNAKEWKYQKLSNRFIDWLFRHYYTEEMIELWYDSEDYLEECGFTPEEIKTKRLEYNNWIEPIGRGIWDMSQTKVDITSREMLKFVRSIPTKKKDRLYINKTKDEIHIYWYGRDCDMRDFWWHMKRRKKQL